MLSELPAILARSGELRIGATLRLALIAIFGAAGTLARYGLQGIVHTRLGSTFPYGTLLVNYGKSYFSETSAVGDDGS